jgi:hypothetical protein
MVQVVAFDEAHNTLNMLKWMRNFQNFLLEHKLLQTQWNLCGNQGEG